MEDLPESVDRDILENRIIFAVRAIREASGCTLHRAVELASRRYGELRRDRPDDFRPVRGRDGRSAES
jgi:hypothetical protein